VDYPQLQECITKFQPSIVAPLHGVCPETDTTKAPLCVHTLLPSASAPVIQKHWADVRPLFPGSSAIKMAINDPTTDSYVSGELYKLGTWERSVVKVVYDALVQGRARSSKLYVLDVGAHVGYFSALSVSSGFPTLSFEPMKSNRDRMLATHAAMEPEVSALWTIYHNAVDVVSGASVHLESTDPTKNSGNYQVTRRSSTKATTGVYGVDYTVTLRLDDVFRTRALWPNDSGPPTEIAVLKVDVEGYEARVIAGAVMLICTQRVYNIILEFVAIKQSGCDWLTMLRWFDKIGYEIKNVNGTPINKLVWDRLEWRAPQNIWLRLIDTTQTPHARLVKIGDTCLD